MNKIETIIRLEKLEAELVSEVVPKPLTSSAFKMVRRHGVTNVPEKTAYIAVLSEYAVDACRIAILNATRSKPSVLLLRQAQL